MRRVAIAGVLLLCAAIAISWFAVRRGGPAPSSNTAPGRPENRPRFWKDDDGANAIRSLGYDQAYLFRWQNSHVDGWVELDGQGGPKRATFDTRQAPRPDEKPGRRLDPGRLSGFVVVAMRKLPSAEWEEYEVRVEQRFEYDMGSGERAGYNGTSHLGKVRTYSKKDQPRSAWVGGNFSANLMKDVDGKSANWFELRLVPPSD